MKKYIALMTMVGGAWMMRAQTPADEWTHQVDKVAVLIKTQPDVAEDAFHKLLKGKNGKNADLLVEIGRAYLNAGELSVATDYAKRAKNADKHCADAYVLSGDIALLSKNVNQASADYNQAIYFDEDCSEAYLKYAELYQAVSPQYSIEILERLQSKLPGDVRIDKQLGDTYYGMGEYGKAIEAYDRYWENGVPNVQDFVRYATLLYLNKNFKESLAVVDEGLPLDMDNEVLMRLSMYNHYELGNYEEGLEHAKLFFAPGDSTELVYLDYVYYGRLLNKNQCCEEASVQYEQALALDSTKADVYQELVALYEKQQDYPKAIVVYKRCLEATKDPEDIGDLFLWGRLNYYAAANPDLKAQQPAYLADADAAFARVTAEAPENYLGFFWRARTCSLNDPETTEGLAKPYYEKVLVLLEQHSDASVPVIVECLSYLGYYYFVQEDYPKSKEYWMKILTVEPNNETAKTALEGMK